MARHKKTLICTLLLVVLLLSVALPAAAASVKTVMYLPSLCGWASPAAITRSGNYYTLLARNHSVYPYAGGTDNLTTVVCRVMDPSYQIVLTTENEYVLLESATSNSVLEIKDGLLDYMSVRFQFRSVTHDSAETVIYYNGR